MDNGKPTHLYIDIKERIKEDIKHMAPHTRLPSRTAMMKRYGVTRTTIEKAVSELTGSGYLYSVNGSGTYVSDSMPEGSGRTGLAASRTWGVVLPSITEDLYPEIVRGIEDTANVHGIHIILCNSDNDADKQHAYFEKLANAKVQGVIVVPAITRAPVSDSFDLLASRGIPFVFCNRIVDGVDAPRVLSNNFYGAYLASKYLTGLGYRGIAYIASPLYSVADQRYQGYLAALYEAGIVPRPEMAVMLDESNQKKAGYEASSMLFALKDRPEAVVCFNDEMAEGLYEAAKVAGLEIGKDLAVVGYGDTRVCDRLPVKLTSVKYGTYETGKHAAEILLRAMRGEAAGSAATVVLQPGMSIRESCGETVDDHTL
ncbi:substrate-binding domain-containing protein [Paenibacillus alkalitolerans]|uniref:substrate-binding domain-containing protein n=1 Tax=Paenibacillus alkalitolerans TaxID=2799335 RepID=UPI0018F6A890|nr:GntR family transcriptional regulator [Paenibacillus alkalitolerans]